MDHWIKLVKLPLVLGGKKWNIGYLQCLSLVCVESISLACMGCGFDRRISHCLVRIYSPMVQPIHLVNLRSNQRKFMRSLI